MLLSIPPASLRGAKRRGNLSLFHRHCEEAVRLTRQSELRGMAIDLIKFVKFQT
jgi:hypothetical protein